MNIVLPGSLSSALSHLMLLGVSSILEESDASDVRVRWEDGSRAVPALSVGAMSISEVAQRVRAHAERHAQPASWVQSTATYAGGKNGKATSVGTMSPRVTTPSTRDSWKLLSDARNACLDGPGLTWLDRSMIAALGQPAYWRMDRNAVEPDQGATRWEMKTRNRGEEFVGSRLSALAKAVTRRSLKSVEASLSGDLLCDDLTKANDSRTSTGLTRPGPADGVLVWCALWGISCIPLVVKVATYAQTAGAYPRHRVAPDYMALPVATQWMTRARWQSIIASAQFDVAAFGDLSATTDAVVARASKRQLESWGAGAIVRFPVIKAGSTSAPERQLGAGSVVLADG